MIELDYQSAETVDPRAIHLNRIFFRRALICGVLPMTIGLTILGLYYLFEWDFLPQVGMLMILIGGVVVLFGIGLIITWCVQEHRIAKRLGTPSRWYVGILVLLLLLANFPVALFCMVVGDHLGRTKTVATIIIGITNETGVDLTDVRIHTGMSRDYGGTVIPIGTITSGTSMNNIPIKVKPGYFCIYVKQSSDYKMHLLSLGEFVGHHHETLQVRVKSGPTGLEIEHEFAPHTSP